MKEYMSLTIHIDRWQGRNEYRATYYSPLNKRQIHRRLGIFASPCAHTRRGGVIVDEDPAIVAKVMNAARLKDQQLHEEGAYATHARTTLADIIKSYLEYRTSIGRDPKAKSHAKPLLAKFGKSQLDRIRRVDVENWIEEMLTVEVAADKTIRNRLSVATGALDWAKKQGMIKLENNVFDGHSWKPSKNPGRDYRHTISQPEFEKLTVLAEGHKPLLQMLMIGYYTGLRPTEIVRTTEQDFDHAKLTMTVHVKKVRGRGFDRLIAIPRKLSAWVLNNSPVQPMNYYTNRNALRRTKGDLKEWDGVCFETLRDNYNAIMEQAGARLETIDAHCGRYQNSVICKNYLRDRYRAVDLMRPYVEKVFDGGDSALIRVVK